MSGLTFRATGTRPGRRKVEQDTGRKASDGQSTDAGHGGQQHALHEHLAQEPPASGAERETQGELGAPGRRARQQQVCRVRAANQQQDRDDRHQDRERRGELAAKIRKTGCGGIEDDSLVRYPALERRRHVELVRRLEDGAAWRASTPGATLASVCTQVRYRV